MANLHYPSDLPDTDKHPAWIQFEYYNRKSPTDSARQDTVQLYMPEQAAQPSTVSWGTENFGYIGNAIATGARAANATRDMAGLSEGLRAGADATKGGGDLALTKFLGSSASTLVGFGGGNASAEGLIGESLGKIPNPYLHIIFRGVDFRTFTFVFKFYPFNEKDCETINAIIRCMRANSLPEYSSGETFLGYPAECQISYKWRGKDNHWLHRFKPAVCTGIDVNYTGQGMFSVMRNGFPSEITVSTKWSEIQIVTRDDIKRDPLVVSY